MTLLQRLRIRASELRQKLNELAEVESPTDEQRAAMDSTGAQFRDVETRLRAAEAGSGGDGDGDAGDGGGDTLGRLIGRVEFRRYLAAAASGGEVDGAERELREHFQLAPGTVPWAALLPIEQRADAVTASPASVGIQQAEIVPRVFAGGAADLLGVSMPTVPVGQALYPVITAGASAAMVAADGAKDAEAATITATAISPTRLQARYLFRREDTAKLSGMEAALRADLAGELREVMDAQVLTGDGSAPNVAGFLAASGSGGLAAATAPGATVSAFADFAKGLASGVDGRYAAQLSECRIVMGTDTYTVAAKAFAANTAVSAIAYLREQGGGVRASAHIEPTTNIEDAILARGGDRMSAVAPVWEGVSLIRDEVTAAAKGQIAVTAVALWGFRILRAVAFKRLQFRTAV